MLLALKLPNQSLNGPIYSIRDQAAKLLWIPRNSMDTAIFPTPDFLQVCLLASSSVLEIQDWLQIYHRISSPVTIHRKIQVIS